MDLRVILSILVLIIGFIIVRLKIKKQQNFMGIILIAIYVSASILTYPIFEGEGDLVLGIVNALFFVLQACFFNISLPTVQTMEVGNLFIQLLLSLELISLPILAAGTVFEILQVYFGRIKMMFMKGHDIHIFSEINDKSIKMTEFIEKDYPNDKIVFCNSKNTDQLPLSKKGKVFIKEDITNLKIKFGTKQVRFYVMEEQEEKVLEKTVKLVEQYKKHKCEILCFTSNEENKMILDELDKEKAVVNIIDEVQNEIYHLLISNPLYANAKENKIKVLIVGLGNVGKEALKSILWCGQMPKYTLEINAVEKDEEKVKQLIYECPEIFKFKEEYNLEYCIKDIRNIETNFNLQEQIKGTTYAIIATGNEENNIKIARNLKRFFIKNGNEPEIFASMQESVKKEQIRNSTNPFAIKTFGDYKETYDFIQKNSKLETMAIKLHLTYNPEDKELIEYNKIEYNKKSSRATALHIAYKLYPYVNKDTNGNILEGEIEKILNDEKILLEIAESEHKRWLAYLRTEGYELATKEVASRYFEKTNKIREHFLRLHPALTNWENLDEVKKLISRVDGKPERDLKQSTINSVVEILKSLGKETKNV